MKKRFLASVADVDLFEKDENGDLRHFATAKTLTDSSIGFSIQMEEVRGGRGAKLYGKYGHTTGMTFSMTDVMFDLNYIRVLLGAAHQENSVDATIQGVKHVSKSEAVSGATFTLDNASTLGKIAGLDKVIVWARAVDGTEANNVTVTESNGTYTAAIPTELIGKEFCFYYYKKEASAYLMNVSATYFPQELVAIMDIQEYAGEASEVQTGKPFGHLIVKIPRYQLDGQFDLALNMTSAANVSLNGSALAVDSVNDNCEYDSYYAEIVEMIEGEIWYKNIVDIVVDPQYAKVTDEPHVYGIYNDGTIHKLNNADITALTPNGFAPALSSTGKWASATANQSVTVNGHTDTLTISAS